MVVVEMMAMPEALEVLLPSAQLAAVEGQNSYGLAALDMFFIGLLSHSPG